MINISLKCFCDSSHNMFNSSGKPSPISCVSTFALSLVTTSHINSLFLPRHKVADTKLEYILAPWEDSFQRSTRGCSVALKTSPRCGYFSVTADAAPFHLRLTVQQLEHLLAVGGTNPTGLSHFIRLRSAQCSKYVEHTKCSQRTSLKCLKSRIARQHRVLFVPDRKDGQM